MFNFHLKLISYPSFLRTPQTPSQVPGAQFENSCSESVYSLCRSRRLSSLVSFDIVSLQADPLSVLVKFLFVFFLIMCSMAQLPLEICSSIFRALFLSLRLNHVMFDILLTRIYILSGVMLFKMVSFVTYSCREAWDL